MKKLLLLIFLFVSSITIGQGRVMLAWNPSTDNVGVAGYCVWVNGERHDSTEMTQYEFDFEAGDYLLTVSAYDAAGNESEQSQGLSVNIADVTIPAIPDLISVEYLANAVKVSWLKSTDNVGVAGYYVYVNGNRFASTTDNYYEFSNTIPNSEYKISISAYDDAGNESERSSEFDIKFPGDDLAMRVYPNPNSRGIFTVLFEGGTIKDNSVIQMIDMLGKIVYERQIIAGPTPYEQNFDLRNLLVEGTYAVVLMVNGKRVIYSYLIVTKPRVYTSKYLLEYLDIQKE